MSSNKQSLQFREAYHHHFAIQSHLQSDLSYYKRLHWSTAYFLAQWNSNISTYAAGTIRRYNQIHHVNFCSGCSLGKIKLLLESYPNLQLDLSFRKAEGLPAFVLVDFIQADKAMIAIELYNEDSANEI